MEKYTIKSTSEDGVFYLVNGWYKHRMIWISEKKVMENKEFSKKYFFQKPQHAKASLAKLLKVMTEYKDDCLEMVKFQ